jgi:hypothetical protein
MSESPIPPLVLFEDLSYQLIFGSLRALLDHVEAIDVRNDEFTVFDRHARRVQLAADSDDGPVTAELVSPVGDGDALRDRLADLVRQGGPAKYSLIDADLELDGLLRAVWRREHPRRPYPESL